MGVKTLKWFWGWYFFFQFKGVGMNTGQRRGKMKVRMKGVRDEGRYKRNHSSFNLRSISLYCWYNNTTITTYVWSIITYFYMCWRNYLISLLVLVWEVFLELATALLRTFHTATFRKTKQNTTDFDIKVSSFCTWIAVCESIELHLEHELTRKLNYN